MPTPVMWQREWVSWYCSASNEYMQKCQFHAFHFKPYIDAVCRQLALLPMEYALRSFERVLWSIACALMYTACTGLILESWTVFYLYGKIYQPSYSVWTCFFLAINGSIRPRPPPTTWLRCHWCNIYPSQGPHLWKSALNELNVVLNTMIHSIPSQYKGNHKTLVESNSNHVSTHSKADSPTFEDTLHTLCGICSVGRHDALKLKSVYGMSSRSAWHQPQQGPAAVYRGNPYSRHICSKSPSEKMRMPPHSTPSSST